MSDAKHVIILGIDGLRPDMVGPDTMPVLAALRDSSAGRDGHRTVYPSETRCALTALVCGARRETTGVQGKESFARGCIRHCRAPTRSMTGTRTRRGCRAAL